MNTAMKVMEFSLMCFTLVVFSCWGAREGVIASKAGVREVFAENPCCEGKTGDVGCCSWGKIGG